MFLGLAVIRSTYPYELEWIEGAFVDEVNWIAAGGFPYVSPSIQFIPTSKTPFFFYLAAGFSKILGAGFLAPRWISILATLGVFGMIFYLVSGETKNRAAALIAVGIYAAGFRFSGAWMDLAKTDSLFLFLVILAFTVGYRMGTRGGMIASGFLFVLAFFTKQLALPIALVLAAVSLLATKGRSWVIWVSAAILGIAAFAALDAVSQGWFSFYTVKTSIEHERNLDLLLFWKQLAPQLWPALVLAGGYGLLILWKTWRAGWKLPESPITILGLGIALISASWSISLKVWTYDNGLMPALLGLSILSGLCFAEGCSKLNVRVDRSPLRTFLALSLTALVLLQFVLLAYNPIQQIPTPADRQAAGEFVKRVNQLPGSVWIFIHGYYGTLADKGAYIHSSPYGDIAGSGERPGDMDFERRRRAVLSVFTKTIEEQNFDWVIIDDPDQSWPPYYLSVEKIHYEGDEFYPVTGARTRPRNILAKNPVAQGGSLPLTDEKFSDYWLYDGWGGSESWGRWAIGNQAIVQIYLEANRAYNLKLRVKPYCENEMPAAEAMNVTWNESSLGHIEFADCEDSEVSYQLPADLVEGEGNVLGFTVIDEEDAMEGNPRLPFAGFEGISFVQK